LAQHLELCEMRRS